MGHALCPQAHGADVEERFPGRAAGSRTAKRDSGAAKRQGEIFRTKISPLTCRSCKPGSVPGANPGPLSFIYDGSHLPPPATYPPASDEQPLIAGIHGLATHGTYGRMTSLPPRWALTPPFHPYRSEIPGDAPCLSLCGRPMAPDAFTGGCFLLRSHDLTAIKSLACVALCVARTFLPRPVAGSDRAGLRCKGRDFSEKSRIPEPGFRFSEG